jgi:hypothetical protein
MRAIECCARNDVAIRGRVRAGSVGERHLLRTGSV